MTQKFSSGSISTGKYKNNNKILKPYPYSHNTAILIIMNKICKQYSAKRWMEKDLVGMHIGLLIITEKREFLKSI